MIILNETLILGEFCNSWPLKFKILKITDHSKDSLLQSPPPKMNSALLNLPPPHLQHAIDLHASKLLISLVLITCTTYCFQG